jgi:tetratricopeptide (TPR) repeat protein
MLLARGDLAGAVGKFEFAHTKGPHFADPLKGWGDALVRQGKWIDALAKYDEALKYAPTWPELRLARELAERRVA